MVRVFIEVPILSITFAFMLSCVSAATRLCGIPAATYTNDIEPDIDVLASTPLVGIDSQWLTFKSKHGEWRRMPVLLR